jgi:hypothetical protein
MIMPPFTKSHNNQLRVDLVGVRHSGPVIQARVFQAQFLRRSGPIKLGLKDASFYFLLLSLRPNSPVPGRLRNI